MPGGRRPDPDRLHAVRINGTAHRLAQEPDRASAIAELRQVIDGRTDLAGIELGQILGGYVAEPGMTNPIALTAAALIADSGADPDRVAAAFDAARHRIDDRRPLGM